MELQKSILLTISLIPKSRQSSAELVNQNQYRASEQKDEGKANVNVDYSIFLFWGHAYLSKKISISIHAQYLATE